METVLVEGCNGLGDNVYQRPFIRSLARRANVWLRTPWPELYEDLDIRFVPDKPWGKVRYDRIIHLGYGPELRTSIVGALERAIPLDGEPLVFDLPDFGPTPITSHKPVAVVRPVSLRQDWCNPARNPLPEYVDWIAAELRKTHTVVALGNLDPPRETALSDTPCDIDCRYGQLSVRQAVALLRHSASVVIGGVGWIVPASIALKTPAFIVLGGQGGCNAPAKITDPRMDLSRISWGWPDQFCGCVDVQHECPKAISDLTAQWDAWKRAWSTSAPAAAAA